MCLSIVLLTWNSKQYVEKCLRSILGSLSLCKNEIIIIDNGSSDGTIELVENNFPQVRIIKNPENRGIAPARNQGIRASQGDYVLILDIDTTVYLHAIQTLIGFMDEHPEAGLCAPKLQFEDGETQNSRRQFPVLHGKILRRINTDWARNLLEKEYYTSRLQSDEACEVDYAIGACQLIRRKALAEVGLLDENIFYGPEDVDICLRMWLKGWKVFYVPQAQVIHYEQRITKKKLLSYITLKHIQGLLYYFLKHRYCFSRRKLYNKIQKVRKHKSFQTG